VIARRSILMVVVLLIVLALPTGMSASTPAEQGTTRADAVAQAGPVRPSFSYQGYLTDDSGTPLVGNHNLTFQLWDGPTDGMRVGGDIGASATPFQDGLFTVELPVSPDAFDGRALWLRIGVDGTWLEPRQSLQPVPYALTLRPGARIAGELDQPALRVSNAHPSGTAIEAGGNLLGLDATGQTGVRAVGMAVGLEAQGMTGVKAEGDVGVSGSGIVGVRGTSTTGSGMEGTSTSGSGVEGTSDASSGVKGVSVGGYGVHGKSQLEDGVHGETQGGFSAGVAGVGPTGVFGTGGVVGVSGYTEAEEATGVMGRSKSDKGVGVSGAADGYDGIGVKASAPLGTGIETTGETGIKATGTTGAGVEGEGSVGVAGGSTVGDGVSGMSTAGDTAAAVRGTAPNLATGGYFVSGSGTGVQAFGFEGLHAESTTGTGYGVHGMGSTGVYGEGQFGVGGEGTTAGVIGSSADGVGLKATAGGVGKELAALRVDNTNANHGMAAYMTNASDYATMHLQNAGSGEILLMQSTGGPFMRLVSTPWDEEFRLQYDGNAFADGSWNSGGADMAEMLPAAEGLVPGDVLVIDADGRLARSSGRFMAAVAGVYSSAPGFVGGSPAGGAAAGTVPLAIVGVVPVRASAENGPIVPGDLLVTATAAGHAMRAGANPPQGTVIGKALEPLADGTGMLRMLVSLQ